MKTAALLFASIGSWIEDLSKGKRAVLGAISLLVIGWGAGLATQVTIGDFATHERRISTLEQWRTAHVDTVSVPGIALAENNQDDIHDLREDVSEIREMVYRLYCERFPSECEGRPSGRSGDE